jgi:hypothetical protein
MTRIELASSVWKTEALPLSYIPAVRPGPSATITLSRLRSGARRHGNESQGRYHVRRAERQSPRGGVSHPLPTLRRLGQRQACGQSHLPSCSASSGTSSSGVGFAWRSGMYTLVLQSSPFHQRSWKGTRGSRYQPAGTESGAAASALDVGALESFFAISNSPE